MRSRPESDPRLRGWAGGFVTVAALFLSAAAHGQDCRAGNGSAYAFLRLSADSTPCPANPVVRWAEPRVVFECGFFGDPAHEVSCSGTPADCVAICRGTAETWNGELAGRFSLASASDATPVEFCNPDDGRTSIGGSGTVCDGSAFGPGVIAVTLRINFVPSGELVDADITVNQAFDEFFGRDPSNLRATVAHELGHVAGLDHPDRCGRDFNVLMRSSSLFDSADPCFVERPTVDDGNGARMIYALTGPTPAPTPALCGDADGDGRLTSDDGTLVLRAAAGLSSSCTLAACDVDGNGAVTLTDGVNVLRGAAGLSFSSSCP